MKYLTDVKHYFLFFDMVMDSKIRWFKNHNDKFYSQLEHEILNILLQITNFVF